MCASDEKKKHMQLLHHIMQQAQMIFEHGGWYY